MGVLYSLSASTSSVDPTVLLWLLRLLYIILTISPMPTRILTLCGTGDENRMQNLMGFPTSQPCWTQAPSLPAEVAQGAWEELQYSTAGSCCCCFLLLTVTLLHHRPTVGCSVNAASGSAVRPPPLSLLNQRLVFFLLFFFFLTPFPLFERVWLKDFSAFSQIWFPRGASSLAAGLSCSLWQVI